MFPPKNIRCMNLFRCNPTQFCDAESISSSSHRWRQRWGWREEKKHSCVMVTLKGSGVRSLLRGQRQQAGCGKRSESVFVLHSKVVLAWMRLCRSHRKHSLGFEKKRKQQQSSWRTQLSMRRNLLFTLFVKRPWEWAFAELGFADCNCRCLLWVYLSEWEKSWSV